MNVRHSPLRRWILGTLALGALLGTIGLLNMVIPTHHRVPVPSLQSAASDLQALANQRIFFAHKSVGANIVEGLQALVPDPRAIAITDLPPELDVSAPGIYHIKIGQNGRGAEKIKTFEDLLVRQGLGSRLNIAVLKLCFVDIDRNTDVAGLFESYAAAVKRIHLACPELVLVHCTVPLRVHNEGLRSWARNLIKGNLNNLARSHYNELIVSTFKGSEPIFDIAALESTHADGSREFHPVHGAVCFALCPEYSDDGGHLNTESAKLAAAAFLHTLVEAGTHSS